MIVVKGYGETWRGRRHPPEFEHPFQIISSCIRAWILSNSKKQRWKLIISQQPDPFGASCARSAELSERVFPLFPDWTILWWYVLVVSLSKRNPCANMTLWIVRVQNRQSAIVKAARGFLPPFNQLWRRGSPLALRRDVVISAVQNVNGF